MRIALFIVITLISLRSYAGSVVLLTSLELKPKHIRFLENEFNKTFANSNLNLVIHHEVTPKKLYEVLTSEDTEALLWVSHAAKEKEQVPGRVAESIIVDTYGNMIKNFFTLIPKNLRFLGIVGCQSKSIIDGFRERGNYEPYPQLEIMSFDKKISLQGGFKAALKRAKLVMGIPKNIEAKLQSDTVTISLSKENFENSPSLQSSWVEMGDQIVGLFNENDSTIDDSHISKTVWDKIENKNIKHVRVLSNESKDESIGKLVIESSEPETWWKLFELKGKPLGDKNKHLYIYKKQSF